MNLADSFEPFRAALEQLGVEVGSEVLAVWHDRERHGQEPLPEAALRDLAAWAQKRLADRT